MALRAVVLILGLLWSWPGWAQPTIDGTPDTGSGTGTTVAVTHATTTAGQLIYAFLAVDGVEGCGGYTNSYTELAEVNDGGAVRLCVVYKWSTGGGDTGFTFDVDDVGSSSQSVGWVVYLIDAAENPSTTAPECSAGATGSSSSPDPDSLTPGGGSDTYLWFAAASYDQRTFGVSAAAPTNYTSGAGLQTAQTGASGQAGAMAADRTLTASSENPGAFDADATADEWVAMTCVAYPETVPGGDTMNAPFIIFGTPPPGE